MKLFNLVENAAYGNCHAFCRSELSKDQMIVDLSFKTKVLFWGGVLLGSVSIGILGYSAVRYVDLLCLSIYSYYLHDFELC